MFEASRFFFLIFSTFLINVLFLGGHFYLYSLNSEITQTGTTEMLESTESPMVKNSADQCLDQVKKEDEPISIAMSTQPGRLQGMIDTISNLSSQSIQKDYRIYVYLNYGPESLAKIPKEVLENPRVNFTLGWAALGDIGDAGKMYFWDKVPKGYYFTVDDIFYPQDYLERMIQKIDQYQKKAVVGLHASIVEKITNWRDDRVKTVHKDKVKILGGIANFQEGLQLDRFVNVLGTATTAWHHSTFHFNFKYDVFSRTNADEWLGLLCQKQSIPMVVIERAPFWLKNNPRANSGATSLWYLNTKYYNENVTSILAKQGPWKIFPIPDDKKPEFLW